MNKKDPMIGLRIALPVELYRRLSREAAKAKLPFSRFVRELLAGRLGPWRP